MTWPVAATIAGMWIGAGIGAYGSPATSGAPWYFLAAAIVSGMIICRVIKKDETQ